MLFAGLFWFIAPTTSLVNLSLIAGASIFIDIDHYFVALYQTGKISLSHAFKYNTRRMEEYNRLHIKNKQKQGDFHVFHTVEFHVLVGVLGLFFAPLFFIFTGMVFHSMLDIISMVQKDRLYLREFFLSSWMRRKMMVII